MKSFITAVILSLLTIPAFAQFGNETISITTYYPSPYGVYKNLELFPSDEPTVGVKRGVMYYNASEDVIKVYNNTGAWVNLTGSGSVSSPAYGDGVVIYNFTDNKFYAYNATYKNYTQVDINGTSSIAPTGFAGVVEISEYVNQAGSQHYESCQKVVLPGVCTCSQSGPQQTYCTATCATGTISLLSNTFNMPAGSGGVGSGVRTYSCFQ